MTDIALPSAGELKESVIIQKFTETTDNIGDVIETWTTHAEIRCKIDTVKGNEPFIALADRGQATHIITARRVNDVQVDYRIKYGSRIMQIIHIDVSTRFWMIIEVKEKIT